MNRPPVWLFPAVALAALAGCNRTAGPVPFDPFMGSPRVAPPGTGTASEAPAYYPGPGAGAPINSGSGIPAGASNRGNAAGSVGGSKLGSLDGSEVIGRAINPPPPEHVRGGGVQVAGGAASGLSRQITKALAADQRTDASAGASSAAGHPDRVIQTGYQPNPGESPSTQSTAGFTSRDVHPQERSVIRIVEPSSRTSAPSEPRRLDVPDDVTPITSLPRAADNAAAIPTRIAATGGSPGATGSTRRFGHDPGYGWLEGQLEYSRASSRWKLRYLPIDGESDEFGGSVVLPDAEKVSGHQHGDFVRIEGQLNNGASDAGLFAPEYRVTRVSPLEN